MSNYTDLYKVKPSTFILFPENSLPYSEGTVVNGMGFILLDISYVFINTHKVF